MRVLFILGCLSISFSRISALRYPGSVSGEELRYPGSVSGEEINNEKEIDRTEISVKDKMEILERNRADFIMNELKDQFLLEKLQELQKEKRNMNLANLAHNKTNAKLQHRTNQIQRTRTNYLPRVYGPIGLETSDEEKDRSITNQRTLSFSHTIMSTLSDIGNIKSII